MATQREDLKLEELKLLEKQAAQEETLLQKALRSAVMNIATGGMGDAFAHGGLGDAVVGHGADVTGLNGAQIADGSVIHHGPELGGDVLERPSAGYMAHASKGGSMSVDGGSEVSSIARDMDDAGHLTLHGSTYDVFDYLPGGDIVQFGAGRVDPAQVMSSLAGEGIEHGMMHEAENMGKGRNASVTSKSASSIKPGGAGYDPVEGPHSHSAGTATGIGRQTEGMTSGTNGDTGAGATTGSADDHTAHAEAGRKTRIDPSTGRHIPDADENARDMEELMFEHTQRLDTAVETSEQSVVHTELHAHGRTLAIDTEFEARDRIDIPREVHEAEGHAEKALHSQGVGNTIETNTDDMRFRSQVHAHLDAMSKDEGMSV